MKAKTSSGIDLVGKLVRVSHSPELAQLYPWLFSSQKWWPVRHAHRSGTRWVLHLENNFGDRALVYMSQCRQPKKGESTD